MRVTLHKNGESMEIHSIINLNVILNETYRRVPLIFSCDTGIAAT